MSLSGMVIRLGQTIGPLPFGLILAISGINYVFYVGVLLSFIVALAIITYVSNHNYE